MASIEKRINSDNKVCYYIRTNFRDSNSGKFIRKSMTWTAPKGMSEADAKKKALEVAEEFESSLKEKIFLGYDDGDYTIESYSRVYLEFVKKALSPTASSSCELVFKYINSKIGDIKLKNLSPGIIQAYFDDVDKDKRIQEIVTPKKNYKETLNKLGFTYTVLRRNLKIQHATLERSLNGKNIDEEWALTLCQKTQIPFDVLFKKEKIVSEYAFQTKKKRKTYLRQMLAYAKRQRIIKENYATSDFVFYTKDKEIHQISAMDEEQAKIFYEALINYDDIRIKTSLLVFLLTGFRRGEVAGLKWSDIDFDKRRISINRAAARLKEGLIIKDPKTAKSQRTITIPKILSNQLQEYKDWQDKYIELYGDLYKNEDWLFTQEDGTVINPNTFLFWLRKVLDKAELPHFSLHSLRHTNITLQILSGVPLVTVAGRAGHSRTSTTSDIYSHFVQSSDNGAAEKLDQTFGKMNPKSDNSFNDILELKKEAKENGFDNLKDYIEFLKQSM